MEYKDLSPEQKKWMDERRQKCEVWTRVMGYHRPTNSFNNGKVSEFNERKFFTESACKASGYLK